MQKEFYEIMIGLSDSKTKKQVFDTSYYINIIKKLAVKYKASFTLQVVNGGYLGEDGSFVLETSLLITVYDGNKDNIMEAAKELGDFFDQHEVTVIKSVKDVEKIIINTEK